MGIFSCDFSSPHAWLFIGVLLLLALNGSARLVKGNLKEKNGKLAVTTIGLVTVSVCFQTISAFQVFGCELGPSSSARYWAIECLSDLAPNIAAISTLMAFTVFSKQIHFLKSGCQDEKAGGWFNCYIATAFLTVLTCWVVGAAYNSNLAVLGGPYPCYFVGSVLMSYYMVKYTRLLEEHAKNTEELTKVKASRKPVKKALALTTASLLAVLAFLGLAYGDLEAAFVKPTLTEYHAMDAPICQCVEHNGISISFLVFVCNLVLVVFFWRKFQAVKKTPNRADRWAANHKRVKTGEMSRSNRTNASVAPMEPVSSAHPTVVSVNK